MAQEDVRIVGVPFKADHSLKPNPSAPELQKYGRDLLQITEADAGALQGGMRAWADWQLASGYVQSDRTKGLELLEQGLTALRSVDERPPAHSRAP